MEFSITGLTTSKPTRETHMEKRVEALVENRQSKISVNLYEVEQALSQIKEILECTGKEIGVTLLDDTGIRQINRDFLQRDRPTNVIAFSMQEGEFGNINPSILGDIVISAETAGRDAQAGDMPLSDMIDYLIIHGVLHLLGYDHEKDENEAWKMRAKEHEIFQLLNGYSLETGE